MLFTSDLVKDFPFWSDRQWTDKEYEKQRGERILFFIWPQPSVSDAS
jgi:hypothetical protein